jgi:cysteinyl-tRNA synthetase
MVKANRTRRRAVLFLLALLGTVPASSPAQAPPPAGGYRQAMRDLVRVLALRARENNPDFVIVAQNGVELLTADGSPGSAPAADYLEVLNGVGQEELFYGYPRFNRPTIPEDTRYLQQFLQSARKGGLIVLVIDYCRSRDRVDDSLSRSAASGFLGFASPRRELDTVPRYPRSPGGENSLEVTALRDARNFLYLINPGRFADSREFLTTLIRAPHDLLIIDAFVDDQRGEPRALTREEIEALKTKPQGGRRLVLSYLSVGEAESYRFYWRREWDRNSDGRPDAGAPAWLEPENPSWEGNYKVRYWESAWQELIITAPDSYLSLIIELGFDGVYLDIIDAFHYFEGLQP